MAGRVDLGTGDAVHMMRLIGGNGVEKIEARMEAYKTHILRLYALHAQATTHQAGIDVTLKILDREFEMVYQFGQPALDWLKEFRELADEDEEE